MSDLNLNVAMIGPRGCGKTSVLAIMLSEIEDFVSRLNTNPDVRQKCSPKIQADSFCVQTLKDVKRALQGVAKDDVVKNGVAVVMGSGKHNVYSVDLTVCNVSTSISFHDFPGAYFIPEFHKKLSPRDVTDFKNVFSNADVIVLCVDVPSQITFSDRNQAAFYASYTRNITGLIKESVAEESENRLRKTVLVLPVKSEGELLDTVADPFNGYRQSINPQKNDALYHKVKTLYKDLFAYLEKEQTVDSFYVPVITMGCVKATGMEYDVDSGISHVKFGPVVKGCPLHYYQCNSSALLALCLWSAEAVITQKYKASRGLIGVLLANARVLLGGKWPTEYFKDELLKECSLLRMYIEHWLRAIDYNSLSEEEKKRYKELKEFAANEPFNGCRVI